MAAWQALFMTTALAACGAPERAAPLVVSIVPMRELSGLAIAEHAGQAHLLAVGDESYELLVMPLGKGDAIGVPDPAKSFVVPLPLSKRPKGSELEGVAVAPDGRVAVVSEPGELTFFRVDFDKRTAIAEPTRAIVFPVDHPLAAAWDKDPNERAEGLAFIAGRTFIAKQRNPAALVELVSRGDVWEARGHWTIAMEDATDLAVADGQIWIVGGRANALCRVAVPAPDSSGAIPCAQTSNLPDGLEGKKARWEGLVVRKDSIFVGADVKKTDRPNLAIVPRP